MCINYCIQILQVNKWAFVAGGYKEDDCTHMQIYLICVCLVLTVRGCGVLLIYEKFVLLLKNKSFL